MRTEIVFILVVIVGLLVLTAIRYRKQIAAMIGFARMLRQAKRAAERSKAISSEQTTATALVNCSKCDIWVPQNKAVKFRDGFICSSVCEKAGHAEVR